MGTIKKGILGGVSGKVGNVVGGNWKGIDYLRILPAGVSNPNTELQANQRYKFATVIRFLQPMTEFIRVGFKAYAVKMSAFNAAFSYNYNNAISGVFPDFVMDYPVALVSRGNLSGAVNPACVSTQPAVVKLNWENNSGVGLALESDRAMIMIYNRDKQEAIYLLDSVNRAAGTVDVAVPANYSGDTVHCYLSFMALNAVLSGQTKNAISNSSYAGSVTIT